MPVVVRNKRWDLVSWGPSSRLLPLAVHWLWPSDAFMGGAAGDKARMDRESPGMDFRASD